MTSVTDLPPSPFPKLPAPPQSGSPEITKVTEIPMCLSFFLTTDVIYEALLVATTESPVAL